MCLAVTFYKAGIGVKQQKWQIFKKSNDYNPSKSGDAKNIIKILKECLKLKGTFTDIEIERINKIIDLLENGELPSRIIKDGNKEIKNIVGINDIAKFYKTFEAMIPDTYIKQESKVQMLNKKNQKREKEIILSEEFI